MRGGWGKRWRLGGVSPIFPAIAPSPDPARLIFATSLLSESLAQAIPKNPIIYAQGFNPLSPNSDQQQFSPNNVHTLSRDKVVRI